MEVDRYTCPGCSRDVPISRTGCPHCRPAKPARKKSEKRSWQQDRTYDGLDLPDEDFDYDDFVEREFGRKPHRKIGVRWYWWCLGLGLVLLWLWWAAFGRFLW
jgi:hypothetical protein